MRRFGGFFQPQSGASPKSYQLGPKRSGSRWLNAPEPWMRATAIAGLAFLLLWLTFSMLSLSDDSSVLADEVYDARSRISAASRRRSRASADLAARESEVLANAGGEPKAREIPFSLPPMKNKPSVFCRIMTNKEEHYGRAQILKQSWASRCDTLLFMSTEDDPLVPAVKIDTSNDVKENLWEKSFNAWNFTYHYYKNTHDWYLSGDLNTVVKWDNLIDYLKTLDAVDDTPYYVGRRQKFAGREDEPFNVGFCALVNNRAMNTIGPHFGETDEKGCYVHTHQHADDVFFAECLRRVGIYPHDTRVEEDGVMKEIFMNLAPGHHAQGRKGFPDWYLKYSYNTGGPKECCHSKAAAFHFIQKENMLRKLSYEDGEWKWGPKT